MDQKLEEAKLALAEILNDKESAVNAGPKERPDHNGNPLPRGIVYTKMKRGGMGYIVSMKGIKRKEFGSKQYTQDQLLKQANDYLAENQN